MTTLKQQIESDLLEFMRSKNEIGRNTLRLVLSSIKMNEIEKSTPIDDLGAVSLIQKEIKSRRDSINDFQKGNRQDLVDISNQEISLLEKYLPKQLSDKDIESIVGKVILEVGASTPSDIGKVMKVSIPLIAGQASSDKVNQIVRKLMIK